MKSADWLIRQALNRQPLNKKYLLRYRIVFTILVVIGISMNIATAAADTTLLSADFNTDEGGLATHSLNYHVNNEFGEELIYISDEIVNTIVEEFYVDLSQLEKNSLSYTGKSGDVVEFNLQAEDLNGNVLDRSFEVRIK